VPSLLGRRTPVTTLLLVAIGLVFAAETALGGSTNTNVLVALGANVPPLVWQGQWWRLAAAMFLHIGILHLLFNGWALYQLGALFEILLGSLNLLVVYFVSGIAGSVASLFWTKGLSAGASGAIFGLMGALIAFLLRRREMLTPYAKSLLGQLVLWAGINVVFGFSTPGIDNAAHLGGCAAGFLCGLMLQGKAPRPQPQTVDPIW
jgi:rhomboid protease GluP